MEQKGAIVEKFRLAFETENLIRKCGEWKEKGIFNSVFNIRIKIPFMFSLCRKIVKMPICIVYSGECFAPICARVSCRHEHSVISRECADLDTVEQKVAIVKKLPFASETENL